MDPMSAISAGLGALTSIFGAVGSGADMLSQIFDSIKGLFSGSQSSQAQQAGQETTQGWPQGQSDYALAQININV